MMTGRITMSTTISSVTAVLIVVISGGPASAFFHAGGWGHAEGNRSCTAIGAAGASAASANAYAAGVAAGGGYAMGGIYPTLPAGCVFRPMLGVYGCGGTFLKPAYGANGVYYRVVPGP